MSRTLRIYYREYGTGVVGLEGGYQDTSHYMASAWLSQAAEKYGVDIGAGVQEDQDGGRHVIKTVKHNAIGRYYFMANSPAQVPLGEGWMTATGPDDDMDLVYGFNLPDGRDVKLVWKKMTEDEIDNMHGNDEFGGWHDPTIVLASGESIRLDSEDGKTDAIMLMMSDTDKVESLASAL